MSLYTPPIINLAQLGILGEPYLGGEWNAYISHTAATRLGGLVQTAAGAGAITLDAAASLPATGSDVQVVAISPIISTAPVVITIAAKDNTVAGSKTFTANATSDKITLATAGDATWITGTVCRLTTTTTLPAGLAVLTDYYMVKYSATDYKLASSLANALAGTTIDITDVGTGTHTFNVLANQTIAAVATFSPPAWSEDTANCFQRGYAVDLVPAVTGKQFTDISTLTSITYGGAQQKYDFWMLPDASSYFQVGFMTGVRFNTKERRPIGIDNQMVADAVIKAGKSARGELTARHNFRGFASAAARFLGQTGTFKLEGVKSDTVMGDRIIFTGCRIGSSHDAPEGDGHHIMELSGMFAEDLFFPAPYSAS